MTVRIKSAEKCLANATKCQEKLSNVNTTVPAKNTNCLIGVTAKNQLAKRKTKLNHSQSGITPVEKQTSCPREEEVP
jgi:hypothetical protein